MDFFVTLIGIIVMCCIFASDNKAKKVHETNTERRRTWAEEASIDSTFEARERKRLYEGDRHKTAHNDFNKFLKSVPGLDGCSMNELYMNRKFITSKVYLILLSEFSKHGKLPGVLLENSIYSYEIKKALDGGVEPTYDQIISLLRYLEMEFRRHGSDVRFVATVDSEGNPQKWGYEQYRHDQGSRRMW